MTSDKDLLFEPQDSFLSYKCSLTLLVIYLSVFWYLSKCFMLKKFLTYKMDFNCFIANSNKVGVCFFVQACLKDIVSWEHFPSEE